MSLDLPTYLETRRRFLANRAVFPVEDLAKYAGRWVAWSPDSQRLAVTHASGEIAIWNLREAERILAELHLSSKDVEENLSGGKLGPKSSNKANRSGESE